MPQHSIAPRLKIIAVLLGTVLNGRQQALRALTMPAYHDALGRVHHSIKRIQQASQVELVFQLVHEPYALQLGAKTLCSRGIWGGLGNEGNMWAVLSSWVSQTPAMQLTSVYCKRAVQVTSFTGKQRLNDNHQLKLHIPRLSQPAWDARSITLLQVPGGLCHVVLGPCLLPVLSGHKSRNTVGWHTAISICTAHECYDGSFPAL